MLHLGKGLLRSRREDHRRGRAFHPSRILHTLLCEVGGDCSCMNRGAVRLHLDDISRRVKSCMLLRVCYLINDSFASIFRCFVLGFV